MNLPLPKETRDHIGSDKNRLLEISNLGLLFNKYYYCWSQNWQANEEQNKVFKKDIEGITSKINLPKDRDYVEALIGRQRAIRKSLQSSDWHVEPFNALTNSRLIIGLGGTSVIETGMTLHPLYGFPYLSGSGLKGLARAYAEIALETKPSSEEMIEIFGSEDKGKHSDSNRQGKAFFLDGLPTTFPRLELDIMNPHYGEYYQGNKPPADYLNPVPITFLTVAAGQPFSFAVFSRDKELAEKARQWLIGGLEELGAGGKTNVGYGYFKFDPQEEIKRKQEEEKRQKEEAERIEKEEWAQLPEEDKNIRLLAKDNITEQKVMEIYFKIDSVTDDHKRKEIAAGIKEYFVKNNKWDSKKNNDKQKEKVKKIKQILGE